MLNFLIFLFLIYLVGIILYQRFQFFQKFLIQSSIISGVIVLFIRDFFLPKNYIATLNQIPKEFISLFFAGFLLETPLRILKDKNLTISILRQGIYVWIIGLSQLILGFSLAFFLFEDPKEKLIASIIEIGWIGGYASASAFYAITKELGFSIAGDLGILSATVGALTGTFSGILLANIETYLRKNKTQQLYYENPTKIETTETHNEMDLQNILIGLLLPFLPIAVTFFIIEALSKYFPLKSIPPFFFVIIITTIIKPILFRFFDFSKIKMGLQLFSKISLDILILSAIGSMNLLVLKTHGDILLIYSLSALVLNILLFYSSPFFISHHPELSFINYGMSTGTTATGMLILQAYTKNQIPIAPVVIYASAAPLSAPFIGGGILSLSIPYLIYNFYFNIVFFVLILSLFFLILINRWIYRFH